MKAIRSSKKCTNPWFRFLAIFIIAFLTVFAMFEIKSKHIKLVYKIISKDEKNNYECVLITSTGNNLKYPIAVQFETCEYYIIVNSSTGKYIAISNNSNLYDENKIRILIKGNNVRAVLTGIMNANTYQVLKSLDVDIYTGLNGTGEEILKKYRNNTIVKLKDLKGRKNNKREFNKSGKNNSVKSIMF